MALELNINAGNAAKTLEELEQRLTAAAGAMDKTAESATKLDTATKSVEKLGAASEKLSSGSGLDQLAKAFEGAATAASKASSETGKAGDGAAKAGEQAKQGADGAKQLQAAWKAGADAGAELTKIWNLFAEVGSRVGQGFGLLGGILGDVRNGIFGAGTAASEASTHFGTSGAAALRMAGQMERLGGSAMGAELGMSRLITTMGRLGPAGAALAAVALAASPLLLMVGKLTDAFEVMEHKWVNAFDKAMAPAAQRLALALNQSGIVKLMGEWGDAAGKAGAQFVTGWVVPAIQGLSQLAKEGPAAGSALEAVWVTMKAGGAVMAWLGSTALDLAKWVGGTLVSAFQMYVNVMRGIGEAVGSVIGLIAGGLYNAFNTVVGAVSTFIDVMSRGFSIMGQWIASQLPDWLTGPLASAFKTVADAARSAWQEFTDGIDAAARLRAGLDDVSAGASKATPLVNGFGQVILSTADKAALFNGGMQTADQITSKFGSTAANAADGVNKLGGAVAYLTQAQKAAIVFANPILDAQEHAEAANKASQKTADDYYSKMRQQWAQEDQQKKSGGGGGGYDPRVNGPDGTYPSPGQSYYDRLKQMGYSDKQITGGTANYNNANQPIGGQQGTTDNSFSGQMARALTDLSNQAADKAFNDKFAISPEGLQAGPDRTNSDSFTAQGDKFAADLKQGLSDALNNPSGLQDKLDKLAEQTAQETAAQQDAAAGLIDFTQVMGSLQGDVQNLSGGLDGLGQAMDAMGNEIQQNTQSLGDQTYQTQSNTDATQNNSYSEDANTSATDQNTEANYADAASNNGGGGGGGGGTIDNSGNTITAKDGAYLVPGGFWENAKHFADGGLTDGGMPAVLHPNEAVIPLKGGAVPVQLSHDIKETMLNVGTLGHNDSTSILAALNKIDADLLAFTARASAGSSGGGASTGGGSTAGGGYTSDPHKGMVQTLNGDWIDAAYQHMPAVYWWGKVNPFTGLYSGPYTGRPMGGGVVGAANGIDDTSTMPGMSAAGAPVTVHPNEAIVPLGGSTINKVEQAVVKVSQAVHDLRETTLNVGTLAHNDATEMIAILNHMDSDIVTLSLRSSGGGGGSSGGGSSGGSTSKPGSYSSDPHKGMVQTLSGDWIDAVYQHMPESYWWGQINPFTGLYSGPYRGTPGTMGPVAGAADGLENTNNLPGMGPAGSRITVHPNEAIVNLTGGGRIPVDLRGGGNGGGIHMPIVINVTAKDAQSFGRGATQDQIQQAILTRLRGAVSRIGNVTDIDDPTRKVGAGVHGTGSGPNQIF